MINMLFCIDFIIEKMLFYTTYYLLYHSVRNIYLEKSFDRPPLRFKFIEIPT